MEFARTELPHSGLLTTVPDCPYALLHTEVVKQHFCSRWCRWCPCSCYCFHPDPLLFPGAPACSVSGCTDSNVTAPGSRGEWTDVAVVASLPAGGMACLTLFLEMARVGWPWRGLEWQGTQREWGCSHRVGPSRGGDRPKYGREEQDLPALGLRGLRVISFSDGLCVIDEMGSGKRGSKGLAGPWLL